MSFLNKYLSYYQDAKEVLSLFNNQYAIMPAFTTDQKEAAYRLRHKIYCHELGFEPGNTDEIERDVFDRISTQIVLHFKPLNTSMGCVRFVHGLSNKGSQRLPMEEVCGDSLDREMLFKIKNSGHNYAEISRLGIDKLFRQMGRMDKSKLRSPVRASCALVALLLGVQAYAQMSDTKYLLAIVEKRLWNTMKKLGIPITPMGDAIEHRGKRFPILMDRDEIEKIIPLLMWPLYKSVQRDMKKLAELYHDVDQDDLDDLDFHPGDQSTLHQEDQPEFFTAKLYHVGGA